MKKQKENDDNKVEYGTISLPQPLIDKIKLKIHGTGISSVSAYVAFILRQILSGESDVEIRSRLKKLGYL